MYHNSNWIISLWQCYFVINLPGEGCGPSFEQTWITTTQLCFVPSVVEIDPVVLKKKIFKVFKYNFNIFAIISTWKRVWPFIWTSLNHVLCQVWLKLGQWFLRRRWKCEKFTDRRTDRRQTKNEQKSSTELALQIELNFYLRLRRRKQV